MDFITFNKSAPFLREGLFLQSITSTAILQDAEKWCTMNDIDINSILFYATIETLRPNLPNCFLDAMLTSRRGCFALLRDCTCTEILSKNAAEGPVNVIIFVPLKFNKVTTIYIK